MDRDGQIEVAFHLFIYLRIKIQGLKGGTLGNHGFKCRGLGQSKSKTNLHLQMPPFSYPGLQPLTQSREVAAMYHLLPTSEQ